MNFGKTIRKGLYRLLPQRLYLRTVGSSLFALKALGIGRRWESMEYIYHLPELVGAGATAIDIGANLGYYTIPISEIIGLGGRLYAVEPMPQMLDELCHRVGTRPNVVIYACALGSESKSVAMCNDSVERNGYLGTGQNYVSEATDARGCSARMERGSLLFGDLPRIDFIKCDVEGYEMHIVEDMLPLIARHRPVMLIETSGANRRRIVELFEQMNYAAYTLNRGVEQPLTPDSTKDIIFRPL